MVDPPSAAFCDERSEATSKILLVFALCSTREERSDEL